MNDDDAPAHVSQNRETAQSKLRRSRKHCPVCLAPLPKNATRTKLQKRCRACGANPQLGKQCARCRTESVWQGRAGAACQTCGRHGRAAEVIAT